MKIIIVGGVAGGATAAARLRRLNEKAEIIVLERGEYISQATCGMPYYIGGVISGEEDLVVQSVAGMRQRFNIDVRVKSEAISIDRRGRRVSVYDKDKGEQYYESYDKLILACGASPIVPKFVGLSDAKNVFVLRTISDSSEIKSFATTQRVKRATIIGGGFIGVEMAENLANIGIEVTLIEKTSQVLNPLDFEMAQLVHMELTAHKVQLVLGDGVAEFAGRGSEIVTESGRRVMTDMTILALGVSPESGLARECKLQLGTRGHVIVDERFNAIDDSTKEIDNDIYAIGDMIEVVSALDDSATAVPLAWGANRQGRLVADIIGGMRVARSRIQGTCALKVFDMVVAATGANERVLSQKGIKYTAIIAHRANHASYYPNSSNIALKLLFDESSGRIFGAQAIGREGTEKRIDIIASVMKLNGTIYDLTDLEISYAPPFSSAKDPVNILGYIAENVASGVFKVVQVREIDSIVASGGYLIDVRTPQEFARGHIEGAINVPLDSLRGNIGKITAAQESPIYINCQVGLRAYYAIRILAGNGFKNLYNVTGGYLTYRAYKFGAN